MRHPGEQQRRVPSRPADTVRAHARLISAFGQPVIATDSAGRVVYWNAAAGALYGWDAKEVLGRPVVEVTPSDVSREQADEIMRRLAAGDAWSGEFPVTRRDGTSFTAWVTDLPVLSNDGALIGVVGVSHPADRVTFRSRRPVFIAEWLRGVGEKLREGVGQDVSFAVHARPDLRVRGNPLELDQIMGGILRIVWQAYGSECGIEISAAACSAPSLSEFGLIARPESLIHLTLSPVVPSLPNPRPEGVLGLMRRSSAVAALVARASGFLFVRSDSTAPVTFNLFLPSPD